MASGRKKNHTNAAILREHVLKIKQTFDKFQTKHDLALAKQETAATEKTDSLCKNCILKATTPDKQQQELQEEIERLKQ